jgi:hypothetical protein
VKPDEERLLFRRLAQEPKLVELLDSLIEAQVKVLRVNTDHATILQTQGQVRAYQSLLDKLDAGRRA